MIYLHVPFCHRKCTYCAFYSKPLHDGDAVGRYVDALLDEMERRRGELAHPVRTVYFGGGTPSLLSTDRLGRIVEALRRCFDLSRLEEVTIECNPEDLTPDFVDALWSMHFFNRLSIGIQSLDDAMLRLIGRRHTAAQALDAVRLVHSVGFRNISVDFIYGLPSSGPSPSAVGLDMHAFDFSLVTHVSAYALTVEQGTALAAQVGQGRVAMPDEDEVVRQYHVLHDMLEAEGFCQYEVSNYARQGFVSRHNSRYWDRTPYLGLGPGAHSFALPAAGSSAAGGTRRWNNPDGTVGEEHLTEADAVNELLMTALRTTRGLPLAAVPERYRKRLHLAMQPYVDCGWMATDNDVWRPTAEGLLHADGIAAALFVA